uniref:Uncharacterized protein n=1 Tax=Tetraselmis sp. GSL018 TaxID=582737 RepID=A0A061RRY1_9CHLO
MSRSRTASIGQTQIRPPSPTISSSIAHSKLPLATIPAASPDPRAPLCPLACESKLGAPLLSYVRPVSAGQKRPEGEGGAGGESQAGKPP